MPDLWLPGAFQNPGRNAGYKAGRNSMQRPVAHFTVGADSRSIAERGFFHFLVHQDKSRENGCTQYAEVDAVTWHGYKEGYYDANSIGPGIEFERLVTGGIGPDGLSEAQPLTQNQIDWGRRLIDFLEEWGIPAELYDGPRYGANDWRGWVNHQALDSDRSDGLSRAEWNAMAGIAPGPNLPELPMEEPMFVLVCPGLPLVMIVPDLPEAYEVAGIGRASTVEVTSDQRQYIINSVRSFAQK